MLLSTTPALARSGCQCHVACFAEAVAPPPAAALPVDASHEDDDVEEIPFDEDEDELEEEGLTRSVASAAA